MENLTKLTVINHSLSGQHYRFTIPSLLAKSMVSLFVKIAINIGYAQFVIVYRLQAVSILAVMWGYAICIVVCVKLSGMCRALNVPAVMI